MTRADDAKSYYESLVNDVKNTSFVWLKDDVAPSNVSKLAARFVWGDHKVLAVYDDLRGFAIDARPSAVTAQLEKYKSDKSEEMVELIKGVDHVEADAIVHSFSGSCVGPTLLPEGETIPTGVTRVHGPLTGTVVGRVWIIDSGISIEYDSTELTVLRQPTSRECTKSGCSSGDADDDWGHGTMIAGIIGAKKNSSGLVGVAPGATLISRNNFQISDEGCRS